MAYYKVDKVFTYTETVYVEADDSVSASMIAADMDGVVNADDSWLDTNISEISESDFIEVS